MNSALLCIKHMDSWAYIVYDFLPVTKVAVSKVAVAKVAVTKVKFDFTGLENAELIEEHL